METGIRFKDVKIRKLQNPAGKTKAFGQMTFYDGDFEMTVYGFSIVEGRSGFFVGWPQRKSGEEYFPVVSVTNEDIRNGINEKFLKMYEEGNFVKPQPKKEVEKKEYKQDAGGLFD